MAHQGRIRTRHHDLNGWFAETRRTVPPEAWQTAFAELMADWKRQGRLPTRQSVERFLDWLGQQQQLALADRTAIAQRQFGQSATGSFPSVDPEDMARALLEMGVTGGAEPPIDAPGGEDPDEGPPPQREEVQPSPQQVLEEFLKLVNEIREAKADFETDPAKAIALVRRLVNALPVVIRALVPRDVLSDEGLDDAMGLINDALDLLDALPPEAFSAGLDALQLALDVVGLIPGIGEPVDLVNLVISAKRGQFLDVGLGALSLIPFVGILPGLAKISTGTRRLKRAISVLSGPLRRLFANLADAVGRIGRETRPSSVRDTIRKLREELKRLTEGVRDATKRQADEAAGSAGRRADEGAGAAAEGAEEAAQGARGADEAASEIGRLPERPPSRPAWNSTQTHNTTANARRLRANLGSRIAKNEQAHHIVAGKHSRAQEARDLLDHFEVDINSAENGVGLARPVHEGSGLHTNTGIGAVTDRLNSAIRGVTNWESGRAAVIAELRKIGDEIKARNFEP